jgi:hypothetical protein
MFRTTANVTGDMAVAAVLGRWTRGAQRADGTVPAADGVEPPPCLTDRPRRARSPHDVRDARLRRVAARGGDAAFWLVAPLVVAWRMRGSRSLDEESADAWPTRRSSR